MINLQEGIDMQTVSNYPVQYDTPFTNFNRSIWESTREYMDPNTGKHNLTLRRAVHNFCTSQKAVSSSNQGVIGGAHRGGKFP
jgi:hypothetical protein